MFNVLMIGNSNSVRARSNVPLLARLIGIVTNPYVGTPLLGADAKYRTVSVSHGLRFVKEPLLGAKPASNRSVPQQTLLFVAGFAPSIDTLLAG